MKYGYRREDRSRERKRKRERERERERSKDKYRGRGTHPLASPPQTYPACLIIPVCHGWLVIGHYACRKCQSNDGWRWASSCEDLLWATAFRLYPACLHPKLRGHHGQERSRGRSYYCPRASRTSSATRRRSSLLWSHTKGHHSLDYALRRSSHALFA